jgi:hypothetical protein
VLDENNSPVFVYHKFDPAGNTQLYIAQIKDNRWQYYTITKWDYRWFFSGNGSINSEILLKDFRKRNDGNYEVGYWHTQYGDGTILLNNRFENIGAVLKPKPFGTDLKIEGTFPGLQIQTSSDIGKHEEENVRYILKWETLNRNRDKPRPEPWPEPSQLYLYKLKK